MAPAVKDALSGLRVPWQSKDFLGFHWFSFVFRRVSLVFEHLAAVLSVLMARFELYKGYTYVGTSKGSFQYTPGATGTSLRPLVATFLGRILGTKPFKHVRV